MPALNRSAIRVSWDTSYAGTEPIERYDVLCDEEVIGTVPHVPQITQQPFHFDDILSEDQRKSARQYRVRAVDAVGNQAESNPLAIDLL